MQVEQDNTTTGPAPRPLSGIIAVTRQAICGQCQAPASIPCLLGSRGTTGIHALADRRARPSPPAPCCLSMCSRRTGT